MSNLESLIAGQGSQPSEYDFIQSLLQGGGNVPANSTPVPMAQTPMAASAMPQPQSMPQGELAALDTDTPEQIPQASLESVSPQASPATSPLTVASFIQSQMQGLEDPIEIEKKSAAEEANAAEILAQLNSGAEKTPFLTELLTAAAALAPAFINKGSGAAAGLESYNTGRKQLIDEEENKRRLLTDRFKISQAKTDRYDNKAASIRQQKTGMLGSLLSAEENRDARAEESKQRSMDRQLTREANALQREAMNADRDARRAADERDRSFRRDMMAKELNLRERDFELKTSAEDRRERGQQLNKLQKESETSLGGVLARIPGKEISPKDAEFVKSKAGDARNFFSKMDEMEKIMTTGMIGNEKVDLRDSRVYSLASDIIQSASRLRGMGANWTLNEQEVTEAMTALRSGSYGPLRALLERTTGLTEQGPAFSAFARRTKGGLHADLAARGTFWPGRYNEVLPETLEDLKLNTANPRDYYTLVSGMKYGIANNPDAKEFDSQYASFPSPGSVLNKSSQTPTMEDPVVSRFVSPTQGEFIKYKSGRVERVSK